jgi:hypothetical protein
LDAFRGEPPVDLEGLVAILLAVGEIAVGHPDIVEIDINPLIIGPDGKCVAADALIVLRTGDQAEGDPDKPG